MEKPSGYSGPEVELMEYDAKTDDVNDKIAKMMKHCKIGKSVGCFNSDKEDG